jgi:hypothetical protein
MKPVGMRQDPEHMGDIDPQATHPLERPPISVIVGVVSGIAAVAWIAALTPSHNPTLTVEFPQSWSALLIGVALVTGTLLGARILWIITVVPMLIGAVFAIGSAITDPQAQTIGGAILLTVAVVCLLLPSSQRFEVRKIRLVLV